MRARTRRHRQVHVEELGRTVTVEGLSPAKMREKLAKLPGEGPIKFEPGEFKHPAIARLIAARSDISLDEANGLSEPAIDQILGELFNAHRRTRPILAQYEVA